MGSRSGVQLRENMADVALDGFFGEEEPVADFAVGQPVADQLEHLELAGGWLLVEGESAGIYEGRRYILCAVDAVGVEPRQAYLQDALTGEEITVLLDELKRPIWDDRNGH